MENIQNQQPCEKLLYSKKDAARMLSLSTRTIDNAMKFKRLAFRRKGKRVLFEATELKRYARQDDFKLKPA